MKPQVQRTIEHTPKDTGGDIYQFAADYPGVMVSLCGAMLIVIWFFIRKK